MFKTSIESTGLPTRAPETSREDACEVSHGLCQTIDALIPTR